MPTVGGLFDGCGLLAYGLTLAGWKHSWLCEVDQWRRELLGIRWPGVPIVGDVRAVGADSVPRVELIAGGFPCKGASTAGKRTGLAHPETRLWREMARAVGELRPRFVLIENKRGRAARQGSKQGLPREGNWGELRAEVMSLLPTPAATEGGYNKSPSEGAAIRPGLDRLLRSRGASTSPQSDAGSRFRDWRLSPSFVEWMIGAPAGWSDPDCPLSAMEFKCSSDGSPGNT